MSSSVPVTSEVAGSSPVHPANFPFRDKGFRSAEFLVERVADRGADNRGHQVAEARRAPVSVNAAPAGAWRAVVDPELSSSSQGATSGAPRTSLRR